MIKKIDHIVITTADSHAIINFYEKLGFNSVTTSGRCELFAGDFKINVHTKGNELSPHATNIRTGSADICLEISDDIITFKHKLESNGLSILEGVVLRNGTKGVMQSIYLRDPDGNLVEFCSYE